MNWQYSLISITFNTELDLRQSKLVNYLLSMLAMIRTKLLVNEHVRYYYFHHFLFYFGG